MASKRHRRRRSCEGKKQYPNEDAARAAARALTAKMGTLYVAYPCEFGKHWHAGRPSERQRRAMRY